MEITIVVHGGAKPYSRKIDRHKLDYEKGIREAINAGYNVLAEGGSAINAVHAAVASMEDNQHFNAGRGSAINNKGQVEMDASIMDGSTRRFGAVALLRSVKNPVSLAKTIMEKSSHAFLAGKGAFEYAQAVGMETQPDDYFITEEQRNTFVEAQEQSKRQATVHGTVGAVAIDHNGNIAAATSTGGTENKDEGRISDSCIIGAGCYADKTCGVSATGDGEFIMQAALCFDICNSIANMNAQAACDHVIHEKNKNSEGDLGAIAIDKSGNIGISFNTDCMVRGWKSGDGQTEINVFQ
jgi:beta-aspartyl-peptidase (threonine type)